MDVDAQGFVDGLRACFADLKDPRNENLASICSSISWRSRCSPWPAVRTIGATWRPSPT